MPGLLPLVFPVRVGWLLLRSPAAVPWLLLLPVRARPFPLAALPALIRLPGWVRRGRLSFPLLPAGGGAGVGRLLPGLLLSCAPWLRCPRRCWFRFPARLARPGCCRRLRRLAAFAALALVPGRRWRWLLAWVCRLLFLASRPPRPGVGGCVCRLARCLVGGCWLRAACFSFLAKRGPRRVREGLIPPR